MTKGMRNLRETTAVKDFRTGTEGSKVEGCIFKQLTRCAVCREIHLKAAVEAESINNIGTNAAANGVAASTFVAGRAEDALDALMQGAGLSKDGAKAIAVVDPPRAGLHARVLASLRSCPAVRRIVYVSCNPESMAADAAFLCALAGGKRRGAPFALVRAAAVDLFPHTAHCEAVVLLER